MRRSSLFVLVIAAAALPVAVAAADPHADLMKVAADYWEGHLEANPVTATITGDHRYDDRLDDNSPKGIRKDIRRLESVLKKARAIDASALSPADRLNRSALIEVVESQLANAECRFEEWVVDPLRGPQVWLFNLSDITPIGTPRDAANYVSRVQRFGTWLEHHIGSLRMGLKQNKVASHDAIRKAIEQLEALQKQPMREWAVLAPLGTEHTGWNDGQRRAFERNLTSAVEKRVKPALAGYHAFLRDELLPAARPQDKAGLVALTDGLECYRKRIRSQTSLDLDPDDVHRIGLEQVATFRADLSELGARVLGTSDVAEIQKKLRGDPEVHFVTAVEVEAKANEALARARAAIPAWFGILPQAECEVKVMGMHEAPNSTIAYYRRPPADGSRPGYYMLNTYRPETRPRYEAEALAFHEAIPGHHLQISIAQELEGLPAFRRHQGVTAFVEGWALYTERLADEMGLYSSDLDRIGMLSYDAWRACRLVVDTGMHAKGWSRQQAIDYMVENTVLAENNIVNEVDRYLTWPGQALAYKIGQLEILRLRAAAKEKLGGRFDIKAFHDAVLRNGAVALPVLREQVEAWVAETAATP